MCFIQLKLLIIKQEVVIWPRANNLQTPALGCRLRQKQNMRPQLIVFSGTPPDPPYHHCAFWQRLFSWPSPFSKSLYSHVCFSYIHILQSCLPRVLADLLAPYPNTSAGSNLTSPLLARCHSIVIVHLCKNTMWLKSRTSAYSDTWAHRSTYFFFY